MDSKLVKHNSFPKPSLLKDFLREEMSSCSSNGFKSLPRRQCCTTTVRFLIDVELKNLKLNQHKKSCFFFNRSPPSLLPAKSAASSVLRRITAAVKGLPFAAWGSTKNNGVKKIMFWRKKSGHKAASLNLRDGKRKEAGDEDEDKVRNGDVLVDSTTGGATESSTEEKQRSVVISEERQHFSPGSVLDCPFNDDDEASSPFQYMEESRKNVKVIEKIVGVEPHSLSKLLSLEDEQEKDAKELLHRLTDTLPSSHDLKINDADKLLFDFFKEKRSMHSSSSPRRWTDDHLIEEAEHWVNGTTLCDDALFLGWNRQPYEKEMGVWKSLDEEIGEVVLELEEVVLHELLHDLLVDIPSRQKKTRV